MMRQRALRHASIVAFALACLVLIFVGVSAYRRLGELREATRSVEHTLTVQSNLTSVLAVLTDAETAQRGFLLTGAASYLEPYDTAMAALPPRLARLRELIRDNPEQLARMATLEALTQRKLAELKATIAARTQDGPEAAVRIVAAGEGKRVMDEVRRVVETMQAAEGRLLTERTALQAEHGRDATQTIVGSALLALMLVAAATLLLSGATRQRDREAAARTTAEQIAAAIAASEDRLRVTLESIGDAVVATDAKGRVTLLNPVGEALTGWSRSEALGRDLADVLVIVNEYSRQPAENPVARVLRDGVTSGLANHTILLAKDGREIPIDDSAAPIRTGDGRVVGAVMVFRDISERRRHEESVTRLAAIVETSEDAIFTTSLDGTTTSWNRGAERMFGHAAAETLDRPLTTLIPADRVAEETELRRRVGAGERVEAFETERIARDGRRIRVSVSLSPLTNRAGTIVGISTIARDVSEQARLLEAERVARAEADQANRAKNHFLAVLSHELRQPLNTMLGWLRMLRSQRIEPAQQERALAAIERGAKAQARMIDDLLDIARIEAGKVTLDRTVMAVGPLVAEIVSSLQHEVKARGLTLHASIERTPGFVSADVDRLRQVVVNVIGNAMKFTPSGGRIEIRTACEDSVVRIAISDTGLGIEPDLLPHVFERFRQADGPVAGARSGLGLGLAIVREIVEMHGGTVEAHSPGPGRGATFVVALPRLPAEPGQ